MNKIEVGMWVRYKYEDIIYIGKIKFISEVMGFDETLAFAIDNCMEEILKEDIIGKTSFNIIDLIEKNDLVIDNYGNIYVVDYVFDNYVYTTTKQGNITKTLCDYQIKSIVTKEQFESMEYKIGG